MTDELALVGLECFGHHGVFDHERRDGQTFVIDLVLGIDTAAAAASDDLADTVDYGGLATAVKSAVERDPVDLIETLAQRLLAICLAMPLVQEATVRVHKTSAPIPLPFDDVTVVTQEWRVRHPVGSAVR